VTRALCRLFLLEAKEAHEVKEVEEVKEKTTRLHMPEAEETACPLFPQGEEVGDGGKFKIPTRTKRVWGTRFVLRCIVRATRPASTRRIRFRWLCPINCGMTGYCGPDAGASRQPNHRAETDLGTAC